MDNSVGGELAAGYVLSCVKQEWQKKKKKNYLFGLVFFSFLACRGGSLGVG